MTTGDIQTLWAGVAFALMLGVLVYRLGRPWRNRYSSPESDTIGIGRHLH